MKKTFISKFAMIAILAMFFVPFAYADQIQLYQTSYSYGSGGEFTLRIMESTSGPDLNMYWAYYSPLTRDIGNYDPSFQTFCLETNEYFTPGTTYNITISDRAIYGRVVPGGDPISIGTAWLYYQFATGVLPNYNYSDDRSTSARYLQEIFWYLEGEGSSISTDNPFDDMLISQFGSLQDAMRDNNWAYPVAVLNVTTLNPGGLAQDQLILVGVPEPSILMLMGAGLLSVGLFARRRKR